MSNHEQQKLDSSGKAAVDSNYYWLPIETCPTGVKVQLCCKKYGVAAYGIVGTKELYFDHWAPLPKFKKELT